MQLVCEKERLSVSASAVSLWFAGATAPVVRQTLLPFESVVPAQASESVVAVQGPKWRSRQPRAAGRSRRSRRSRGS